MALRDTLLARQAAREAAAEARRRRNVDLETWAAIVSATVTEIECSLALYVSRDLLSTGRFRTDFADGALTGLAIVEPDGLQVDLTGTGIEPGSSLLMTGVAGCTGQRVIEYRDGAWPVWWFADGTPLNAETFEAALDELISGEAAPA